MLGEMIVHQHSLSHGQSRRFGGHDWVGLLFLPDVEVAALPVNAAAYKERDC
jgi:hypothetical protein